MQDRAITCKLFRGNASSPTITQGRRGEVVPGSEKAFGIESAPASSALPNSEFAKIPPSLW